MLFSPRLLHKRTSAWPAQPAPPRVLTVLSNAQIGFVESSQYNAFTDLLWVPDGGTDGRLLLSYRAATGHASLNGLVRILSSDDGGANWVSRAFISSPRAPTLADNRNLMFYRKGNSGNIFGTMVLSDNSTTWENWVVQSSDNGNTWGAAVQTTGITANYWAWRPAYNASNGLFYVIPYRADTTSTSLPLYSSPDGIAWTQVSADITGGFGQIYNESQIWFLKDGTAVAVLRGSTGVTTRFGVARSPYTAWAMAQPAFSSHQQQSPAIIQLPDGRVWVVSRGFPDSGQHTMLFNLAPKNSAFWGDGLIMATTGSPPFGPSDFILDLTGQKTEAGYPGVAWDGKSLWVSYYVSPDGVVGNVFLARLAVPLIDTYGYTVA